MTEVSGYEVGPQLHDRLTEGVWVQNTMSRNVYQVHHVDPDARLVELVPDCPGRGPLWAPFWIIDCEYREVGR